MTWEKPNLGTSDVFFLAQAQHRKKGKEPLISSLKTCPFNSPLLLLIQRREPEANHLRPGRRGSCCPGLGIIVAMVVVVAVIKHDSITPGSSSSKQRVDRY